MALYLFISIMFLLLLFFGGNEYWNGLVIYCRLAYYYMFPETCLKSWGINCSVLRRQDLRCLHEPMNHFRCTWLWSTFYSLTGSWWWKLLFAIGIWGRQLSKYCVLSFCEECCEILQIWKWDLTACLSLVELSWSFRTWHRAQSRASSLLLVWLRVWSRLALF